MGDIPLLQAGPVGFFLPGSLPTLASLSHASSPVIPPEPLHKARASPDRGVGVLMPKLQRYGGLGALWGSQTQGLTRRAWGTPQGLYLCWGPPLPPPHLAGGVP